MTDEYRLDDQVGYKLRLASQRHLEIFSQHLSDITPTQFSILRVFMKLAKHHKISLVGWWQWMRQPPKG